MRDQKSDKRNDVASSDTSRDEVSDNEDEDDDDNGENNKNCPKKPRKDSGIHSMNSSASTVASDKDIGAARYVLHSIRIYGFPGTEYGSGNSS